MSAEGRTRTDWPRVLLLLACGIFAATQIGKIPPLLPQLQREFAVDLVLLSWVASIFNAIAACLGLLAGTIADRIGRRLLLKLGLAAITLGAGLGSIADGFWLLLATRILEGLGFLSVVVSAPALIRESVTLRHGSAILGVWSIYTAVGMAGMILVGPTLVEVGWRLVWAVSAGSGAICLILALVALPGIGTRSPQASFRTLVAGLRTPLPFLLAACFGLYTLQWMSLMVWLPTMLTTNLGMVSGAASIGIALVMLINAPGNVIGGFLTQRGLNVGLIVLTSGLFMAVSGGLLYFLSPGPWAIIGLAFLFSLIGGILPGAIYAAVPAVAAKHQNFGSLNGLVVQGSNIGSFLGPPIAAAAAQHGGGWPSCGWIYVATGLLSASLALAIRRRMS